MSNLFVAIFMGLIYWFTRLRIGYTFSSIMFQPVSIGLMVGFLYGDVATAMKIGAAVQLVYLGVTSTPGGNVPSDPALASCVAIPIAMQTGMEPTLAVALAVPFGVIGVFLDQLRRTTNSAWVHMADKYAEDANTNGIIRCAFLYPAIVGFILRFPPVFLATLYGEKVVNGFLSSVPEWLLHSFEIIGGLLPALGFAITILVIGKKHLIPFFIMGYFAVKYLQINVMAAAIFGVCFSLLFIYLSSVKKEA
ncbi:PTS sugar transporter subunit IIC [uncultured Fusobacterium sp.]|uniref:PTS mannose/fructose/sorbose/N-acetylgalactosamine transporter subunit IIC n=1 Tax=uncultured Fusobacterium sp. TaxID=159267 RepID=UPI0027DD5F0D|nr:PTS sugar transporter subunit IIC [uncultured Fusobacterium sp.]